MDDNWASPSFEDIASSMMMLILADRKLARFADGSSLMQMIGKAYHFKCRRHSGRTPVNKSFTSLRDVHLNDSHRFAMFEWLPSVTAVWFLC